MHINTLSGECKAFFIIFYNGIGNFLMQGENSAGYEGNTQWPLTHFRVMAKAAIPVGVAAFH